ncbi:MAG TPA: dihydrolipoamide acetyltransferase family protein [Candidatus Dormibacteraeota bacterium]|nr:dihydrolipoamide acetyltransferase family protein [Candidatus Dormibacteraeota bacterium]
MAAPVIMPALGMAQETGTLVRWLHQPGETVEKGEPLMEVETDKAVVEVEAPASGRLGTPLVGEGETVPVGQVIAHILGPDEADPGRPGTTSSPDQPVSVAPAPPAAEDGGPRPRPRLPVPASPKARRLAAERGIDLATIRGSGPEGAVLTVDLPRGERPVPPEAPATMGRIWKLMAERTTASWTSAPHFFLVREADAGRLVEWRATSRRQGLEATYTDLLILVTAGALRRHPGMNAIWEGRPVPRQEVNLAVAVETEEGLVAPVIHRADRLSLAEVVEARRALVERARARRLTPQDLEGGTFTLSNLGMYGVDAFNAILNERQAGILAVGRIAETVVPIEGQVAVRPRVVLTLSCDHRLTDGARAARFLAELTSLLEEPLGLFTSTRPTQDAPTAES